MGYHLLWHSSHCGIAVIIVSGAMGCPWMVHRSPPHPLTGECLRETSSAPAAALCRLCAPVAVDSGADFFLFLLHSRAFLFLGRFAFLPGPAHLLPQIGRYHGLYVCSWMVHRSPPHRLTGECRRETSIAPAAALCRLCAPVCRP